METESYLVLLLLLLVMVNSRIQRDGWPGSSNQV